MSKTKGIGRLETASLTDAWAHEARDFTPWLAKNLDRLSEALGFPLELTQTEFAVDEFSADIVARNPEDDSIVLIENQFKGSDHTHLGQILTYLAGSMARKVIWIAPSFRDAHLSAVRWLNANTGAGFDFFAVVVKVVRIGDSPLAPLFDVAEKPNDWDRRITKTTDRGAAQTDIGKFRRDFWQHYLDRHPEDTFWGVANGAISRWRVHPPVVVAQFIAAHGVGVFYRCERGGDYSLVGDLLEPHTEKLERELGARFNNDRYLFLKTLKLDMTERVNWDRASDWLKEQADDYGVAVESILTDAR